MSAVVRKDTSIWALIAQLAALFGGDSFQLVDHWDADLFAVGIASVKDERRLVYVSTFKKAPGLFAYDCEDPDSGSLEKGDHADLEELLRVLKRHLSIVPGGRP